MTNPQLNMVDSVLIVKSSGTDVSNDLLLPEGKSIAQLLYDQKNTKYQKNKFPFVFGVT